MHGQDFMKHSMELLDEEITLNLAILNSLRDSETESREKENEIYGFQRVRGFRKRNEESKEGRCQDGKNTYETGIEIKKI